LPGARPAAPPGRRTPSRTPPPQPERLADRAHLGAEPALGQRELLEVEARRLDGDVVECRLERRRRLAGDVVRQLVERVADGEESRELRDREARRLRGERRRARDARVHLDHAVLACIGRDGELHVRAAGGDADRACRRERRVTQLLVDAVGQRLLRRDRPRVAGVHAHRIQVLDRADDDGVAACVAHHLELVLLPAREVLLHENLADRTGTQTVFDRPAKVRLAHDDCAAHTAQGEGGTDDCRDRKVDARIPRDDGARRRDPGGVRRLAEELAILGAVDCVEVGADQLDPERCEFDGKVERGLPAERRQDRVWPLALDHLRHGLGVERLEVRRVGPLRVGHDRRRVRVDQHDAVALAPQDAARLRARVVELACLPNPDRAGAEDQDRAKVGALRHVSARRSKKGSASSGPGDASGWNCTLS
jgi:hypothetical protein